MKAFLIKNRIVLGIVVIVLAAGGAVWYVSGSKAPSFTTTTATTGNVIETVDVPGNVMAENSVALSFQEAGQVAHVYVSEGDSVSAGEVLADLDQSELSTAVDQANAGVAAAQAQLDQLQTGTRPQQLQIEQNAVTTAEASLGSALASAYSAADDAIHNQTDNLFSGIQTANPVFLVPSANSQLTINIENERMTVGTALTTWLAATSATSSDPSSLAVIANANIASIQNYLNDVAVAVNSATPGGAMTASVLAGYKTNVVTARTEVVAASDALTAAESGLTTAQGQLTLGQAGATPQDIETQEAVVLQAQAAAAGAQVALDNASLKAPFAGTVSGLTTLSVGQIVAPGSPVLSVTNSSGLKIVADVPETDVGKIAAGDNANVTLDAYGNGVVFPATVTTIDTTETDVNGAPAYEATLHFVSSDSRILDGMSGNVSIIAAEHDNVVEVPSRLVITNDGQSFVLVQNGSTVTQKPVQTGITGDDGMVEIISGLQAGDAINNF